MIKEIIGRYNDRDSLYGRKLTNHLNMGLYSLYAMGASEERLHEFAHYYIKTLAVPSKPEVEREITIETFHSSLGIDGLYSSFIPFFTREMEKKGKEAMLREYIPQLMKGEAGGAFHGLIRMAYAIELDDPDEMIKALSYFAEAYHSFPVNETLLNEMKESEPLLAIKQLGSEHEKKAFEFHRPLIIGRMRDVYDDERFQSILRRLPETYLNNGSFSDLVLQLYLLTGDFTILHGFTSTHALRILEPWIEDYQSALLHHWFLLELAYLSTACAPVKALTEEKTEATWPEIHEQACLSNDVHTQKLVYSLWQQSLISEDDSLYRKAAMLKIQE